MKQRNHLHQIEKKLHKLQDPNQQESIGAAQEPAELTGNESTSSSYSENTQPTQQAIVEHQADSPSPASSSVSLSSVTTSNTANTPPPLSTNGPGNPTTINNNQTSNNNSNLMPNRLQQQQQHLVDLNNQAKANYFTQTIKNNSLYYPYNALSNLTQTPNRYIPSSTNPNRYLTANMYLNQQQTNFNTLQTLQTHMMNQAKSINSGSQRYKKQLSQSFRDILENTLLINGFDEMTANEHTENTQNVYYQTQAANIYLNTKSATHNPRHGKCLANSTSSLNNNNNSNNLGAARHMTEPPEYSLGSSDQFIILNDTSASDESQSEKTGPNKTSEASSPATGANTQIAMKFAELERTLALTKAENHTLLEQQVKSSSLLFKIKLWLR